MKAFLKKFYGAELTPEIGSPINRSFADNDERRSRRRATSRVKGCGRAVNIRAMIRPVPNRYVYDMSPSSFRG